MTKTEFTTIVTELYLYASKWLKNEIQWCKRAFTQAPPLFVIGVGKVGSGFEFCTPFSTNAPKMPVCWISWDTNRPDTELRDVLGQALSVLMRELGMEWPV